MAAMTIWMRPAPCSRAITAAGRHALAEMMEQRLSSAICVTPGQLTPSALLAVCWLGATQKTSYATLPDDQPTYEDNTHQEPNQGRHRLNTDRAAKVTAVGLFEAVTNTLSAAAMSQQCRPHPRTNPEITGTLATNSLIRIAAIWEAMRMHWRCPEIGVRTPMAPER